MHGVEARRRHGCGESAQERERVEIDRERAVAERTLQLQAHEVVGHELDALLRDGWAEDVLAERFASGGVVAAGDSGGVQREALLGGTQGLRMHELAVGPERDGVLPAKSGTGGDGAQRQRHGQLGERGLAVGEGLSVVSPNGVHPVIAAAEPGMAHV